MADLLTHFLVAFSLFTVASWRVDWLDRRWLVVGTGGAAIPDLVKIELVLDEATIEGVLGLPFAYTPLSTAGGVLLVAGLVTLAFERDRWRRAYGLVTAGGILSLVVDGLRAYADGRASAWLYPVTNWRPPTPSLYVSSDPTILVVALSLTAVVVAVDRRLATE
jgi:hypothetical protein